MSSNQTRSKEVSFTLEFSGSRNEGKESTTGISQAAPAIPRIARLMALAIHFEGLVRDRRMRNYAEIARLGRVTRARMTQLMRLLHLAPDIQEQLLFLPEIRGLNERNLRAIVSRLHWSEQRRMFQEIRKNA